MFINAQVVMLPTKEESHVGIWTSDLNILYYGSSNNKIFKPQHLYFISTNPNEEIKEGDWCFAGMGYNLIKTIPIYDFKNYYKNCTKIIASSDPSLGLPTIPTTWIRNVYVPNNGSIKQVNLETIEYYKCTKPQHAGFYHICKTKSRDQLYNTKCEACSTVQTLKLTQNNEIVITHEQPIILGENGKRIIQNLKDKQKEHQQKINDKADTLKTNQELKNIAEKYAYDILDEIYFEKNQHPYNKAWTLLVRGFQDGANWKTQQSANDAIEFNKWLKETPIEQLYQLWQQHKIKS